MSGLLFGLSGAVLGAAWMYVFDPERGRRRRSLARDQFARTLSRSRRELDRATRDLNNRVHGVTASAGAAFRADAADDDLLERRVRSRIGRPASHPHAIEVHAWDGVVTLSGKAPSQEIPALISAARHTPGVRDVEDRLEIAGAQDWQAAPSGNGATRDAWKPGKRLLGGLAGAGVAAYGFQRGGVLGAAAKAAGLGVMARAALNRSLAGAVGLNGRCEVGIQKTITIKAPVDTVYRFWSNTTNFPRFMAHLEEVRDLGGGRSHWVAEGPGGLPVGWNAQTTKRVENEELAWESERGSAIENRGRVRFEPMGENETRVSLQMTYKPPAGLLGHTAASILGVDPKHQMDDDLVRMKSLIELGRTRARHKTVTRQELEAAIS